MAYDRWSACGFHRLRVVVGGKLYVYDETCGRAETIFPGPSCEKESLSISRLSSPWTMNFWFI